MPRVRSQLAIQASPELLARVRAAADARGWSITKLVVAWLEAGLEGALPGPADASDLAARVAALEAAVAALQAERRAPMPRRPAPPSPQPGMPAPPPQLPDAALTTAELADRTGTNRAAWNNWANADRVGQVRSHPQAGAWRLVGKGPGPNGGPDRWLWEPA
jgi:hypothetical protein